MSVLSSLDCLKVDHHGIVIHMWGWLPSTAWFGGDLDKAPEASSTLVANLVQLAGVAVDSGGFVSFEWRKSCTGWLCGERLLVLAWSCRIPRVVASNFVLTESIF